VGASERGRKYGYRSGLEDRISEQLTGLSVPFKYEEFKIRYEVNEVRSYTPDFELPNGIIIESKGRFVAADRKKHLLVQKQHPSLDIRFVFSNSRGRYLKVPRQLMPCGVRRTGSYTQTNSSRRSG